MMMLKYVLWFIAGARRFVSPTAGEDNDNGCVPFNCTLWF